MASKKKVNVKSSKSPLDHALEIARKAKADAVNIPKKPVAVKGKKTVPAALDWGNGIPEDKLAYLNDEEMALLQAHRMFKGKRSYNGIPAFPDPGDTAAHDNGQGTSSSAGLGNNTSSSTYGSGTSTSWGGSSSSGSGGSSSSGGVGANTGGGGANTGGVGANTGGGGTGPTQGQGGSGSGPIEGGGGSAPSASTSDTSTPSSTASAADTSTEEYKAPPTATGPTSMPVNAPQSSSMPPGFQYDNPLPDNYGMTYNPSEQAVANSIASGTSISEGYPSQKIQDRVPADPNRMTASEVVNLSQTPTVPAASQQTGLGKISPAESQALYGMDLSDIPMPTGTSPYNTDPTPGAPSATPPTPASPSVIYSGYADPNVKTAYADALVGNQYGYPGINNTPTIGNKNVNVSGAGYPVVSASTYASPNLSAKSTADVFGNTTGFPRNTSPLSRSVASNGPPGMTPNSALSSSGIPGFSSPLPPNSGMIYNPNILPAAPAAAAPSVPAAQSMPSGYQYGRPLPPDSGMTYNTPSETAALKAAQEATGPRPGQSAVPPNQAVYSPPENQFVNSAKPYNERLITTPDGVTHEVTQEQMQQLSPEDQDAISAANQNITYTPASASPTAFNDTGIRKTVNPYNEDVVNIDNVDPDAPPTDRYIGPTYPGDEEPAGTSTASKLPEDSSGHYTEPTSYSEEEKTAREKRMARRKRQKRWEELRGNRNAPELPEYVPYDYLKSDYGMPAEPDPDIVAFNNYSSTLKRGGRVGNSIDAALRIARQSVVSRNKTR